MVGKGCFLPALTLSPSPLSFPLPTLTHSLSLPTVLPLSLPPHSHTLPPSLPPSSLSHSPFLSPSPLPTLTLPPLSPPHSYTHSPPCIPPPLSLPQVIPAKYLCYFHDPTYQHHLVHQLPGSVRSKITSQRRYISYLNHLLERLVEMGLIEVEGNLQTNKRRDQVMGEMRTPL